MLMSNKKIIFTGTLAALCISLGAQAGDTHAKKSTWHNNFSEERRSAGAPAPVIYENAAVEGPMNTVDTRPGFLQRERDLDRSRMRQSRAEWREDRTVYRSGAPSYSSASSEHSHFTMYGDDLSSLRGLELEMALNHLHHMNQRQIEMAKMAETKAKTPSVLNLAHQIRADHERLDTRVNQIADDRSVDLESFELNTYEKVLRNRLRDLSAPEFETAFLRVIDRGHEVAAADLRMIRDEVNDEQLNLLIRDAIPAMQAHKQGSSFRGRAGLEDGDLGE